MTKGKTSHSITVSGSHAYFLFIPGLFGGNSYLLIGLAVEDFNLNYSKVHILMEITKHGIQTNVHNCFSKELSIR